MFVEVCILLSNGLRYGIFDKILLINIHHHAPCDSSFFPPFIHHSPTPHLNPHYPIVVGLLCGVGVSFSISFDELAISTIVVLGIPIVASFNFFLSPSLKVSLAIVV